MTVLSLRLVPAGPDNLLGAARLVKDRSHASIAIGREIAHPMPMDSRTRLSVLVTMLLLWGCEPREPAASTLPVPPAGQCTAAGGTIREVGLLGHPACEVPTSDAGKICRDSKDCEGRCLVEDWDGDRPPSVGTPAAGQCEASNLTFGCFAEVRRGRIASLFLCVD